MENNMGSGKNNSLRKPMRRRHTRKASQDCVINMVKARREIAHALQLHRSSSSSTTTTTLGNNFNYDFIRPSFAGTQYCYSLMESMTMPIPEPIWSTTAPSILAAPPPPPVPAMEALEFEWGENNQASHTWWLGFLQTLDSKYNEEPKYPLGNSRIVFSQEAPKLGEPPFVDESDQSGFPDEWLIFPTTEDQGEVVNSP
jgi:hypothetical protein